MKIPREAMTPALDAALSVLIGDGSWFRLGESDGPNERDRARALLRRYSELESAIGYGVFFSILASSLVGLFLLAGESPALLALPAVLIGGTAYLNVWLCARRPDGPQPTTDFLEAAIPRLHLAPVQRRYAETLVAVISGQVRDPGGEGLALLRRLAEEEERLLVLARSVEGSQEEVAEEAESLRARLAAARDPSAREALAQSLALAERRLVSADHAASVRERLDAHRALLDQASRTAVEGIMSGSELEPGLHGLRENVASLALEASALEAAVQEMRAL